jgi:hypothetical protein
MRPVPVVLTALAAGALLAPGVLPAQRAPAAPTTVTLSRPEVEYAEPFTLIAGVRELRDGRVVVADRQEKTIQLLDLARGEARPIGREGNGPNEYAMVGNVHAMPGDTTLVFDPGNMRHLVIDPAGRVVRTLSTMDQGEPDMRLMLAQGSDQAGNLYFLDRGLRGPGRGAGPVASPDSGTVLRYEPATRRVTEVGKVALPKTSTTTSGSGGQVRMMRMSTPFAAQDDWTVGTDGRIGIVRHDPYRVEWLAPTGQRVVGPPVQRERVRVTDADKEAYRNARVTTQGMRITIGGGGGPAAASAAPPPPTRPPEPAEWPEYKPPFVANSALVGPDGRLWVLRSRAAGDDVPTYDVFDAYGRLASVVTLPPDTRLVGFGRGSAYVVRTDEDDLQYLQRYRLF